MHQYRLRVDLLETSSVKKDLGVIVDKLNHEPAMLPLRPRPTVFWDALTVWSTYSVAARPHLKYRIQFWAP